MGSYFPRISKSFSQFFSTESLLLRFQKSLRLGGQRVERYVSVTLPIRSGKQTALDKFHDHGSTHHSNTLNTLDGHNRSFLEREHSFSIALDYFVTT